jgi:uncharacterized protein YjlB
MEIRNLPLHRLQEYLIEAGATQVAERRFLAENWQAENRSDGACQDYHHDSTARPGRD